MAAFFFVYIFYLRHTASYRSMAISPQEIYKTVMKLIENAAPNIKEDVFHAHTNLSYTQQNFDTNFTEFWKYNWELITREVQADIIVFIDNETKWAEEENKKWGGDCHREALEHYDEYIHEQAHKHIDIMKVKIIADFQKMANRELKEIVAARDKKSKQEIVDKKSKQEIVPAQLPNRKLKLDSRVGNPLQGRGVLGGRNRYMV